MTNSKADQGDKMRMAEDIMSEDRGILRALASTNLDTQLAVSREVAKRRRRALDKLAK